MAHFSSNDIIFASATVGGRMVQARLSGVESIDGVLAELRRVADGLKGLVRLTLRNASQGWSKDFNLYLRAA
ncbi:MAG: hypothetical protein K2M12_02420 [Muribaculaceae bacterium]|nr:hypothetical protein [Muribaculaceae bacterium]